MDEGEPEPDPERKPRGRPPGVPTDIQKKVFMENMTRIVVDNKLVNSTNPIYQEMAKTLGMNDKQTVYLAVKRFVQRNGLVSQDEFEDSDQSDFIPSAYFGESFYIEGSDIQFQINISEIDIFGKNVEKMQNSLEWSNTFNEVIWEFSRLPCSWMFDRLKKVCNEFVISGRCKSSHCSKLFAYTESDQSLLKIVIKSFNEEAIHLKKISTKYSRKEKIEELLKMNAPSVVRAKLTNEFMIDNEEYEPPLLPNTGTLRNQKYRMNKSQYFHENPMFAIREMKSQSAYFECILDIGLDPFFVMYATPLQKELLRVHTRYRKCVISFDATGAPVTPPPLSSYSTERGVLKTVFLYLISLQLPGYSLPVFQLLSQRNRSNFLQYNLLSAWLYECFGQKIPNEVITDECSALLLASVECLTSCKTMHGYLNACYDALFNKCTPPECFIRLDRAHIVKAILTCDYLQNEDKRRKKLYQRLFGYLIQVEDVEIVQKMVRDIFILLNNKYENDSYVQNAKKYLKTLSDSHLMEIDEEENNVSIKYDSTDLFEFPSKFKTWIENIAEDVQARYVNQFLNDSLLETSDDQLLIDNAYYAPHLTKHFNKFFVKVPLFTNIMLKTFGSTNKTATSSPTEVGFNFIKNILFEHKKQMRFDTFLQKHIDYLQGNMKIYSTKKYKTMLLGRLIQKKKIRPDLKPNCTQKLEIM